MAQVGNTIKEAMIAYEPRVGKNIQSYKTGRQDIERALGSNAGKAATDSIVGEGEDIVRNQKPLQAHNYYMGGDKAKARKNWLTWSAERPKK